MFAHSRDPHPAIKLWCQVPFTKSKTIFQCVCCEMYCMQRFLKSKYIKSSTFNDENRWIIKKVMVLKKMLPHLATTGTYSSRDLRCDEAWREQTLVYPPVMCQQRLSYCTWDLNGMRNFQNRSVPTRLAFLCGTHSIPAPIRGYPKASTAVSWDFAKWFGFHVIWNVDKNGQVTLGQNCKWLRF